MTLYDELTREVAPRITAPRRVVLNSDFLGAKDDVDVDLKVIAVMREHGPMHAVDIASLASLEFRAVRSALVRMRGRKVATFDVFTARWTLRESTCT